MIQPEEGVTEGHALPGLSSQSFQDTSSWRDVPRFHQDHHNHMDSIPSSVCGRVDKVPLNTVLKDIRLWRYTCATKTDCKDGIPHCHTAKFKFIAAARQPVFWSEAQRDFTTWCKRCATKKSRPRSAFGFCRQLQIYCACQSFWT